ncbi:Na+/H+ antiporter NhaC family protein, partial [bacterium]|nr:Na+/H+ antiporter NhaC family protein [bacterium]
LLSLFAGIWLGAIFIYDYNPFIAFMRTIDNFLLNALANSSNASILIFSMTLGGMVGVISRAGGTQGIVQKLAKYAKHARSGQLATWGMGILIFFDDYANSLIVGNTMRPFTDRLRISREKLSYLVDSTAAPVASIALISTWVGYQVGLIDQAAKALGIQQSAYQMFLASIPYATYSILALVFVFLIGWTLRDFGPMRTAELRARNSGEVLRNGSQPLTDSSALDFLAGSDTPLRWYNALIPILLVIVVTFSGLYFSGHAALGDAAETAPLGTIFGAANSFAVLLWASFTGLAAACILALGQRILSLKDTIAAIVNGYKSMLLACMILVLAWAIGNMCQNLGTANYIISITEDILSPRVIPVVTFLAAAFIAFSTGTSWATMAILTPIVVPIAYKFPAAAGLSGDVTNDILIATIGAVLSGAVLGDHCSPISDTTILSSMASAADHVDHVRTQMPYALLVGLVACLTGYIPSGWGLSSIVSILLGTAILTTAVFVIGKKPEGVLANQPQPEEPIEA